MLLLKWRDQTAITLELAGHVLERREDNRVLAGLLDAVIKREPANTEAWALKGLAAAHDGDTAKTNEYIAKSAAGYRNDPRVAALLGNTLLTLISEITADPAPRRPSAPLSEWARRSHDYYREALTAP